MAGLGEVISDVILCSLYIYLLIRLATAKDDYFKSPFYTFFIATGIYSVMTVFFYQIVRQFVEQYWTHYIYKLSYGLNSFAAKGATFGKVNISIHRYFVIRNHDFAEKKCSRSLVYKVLAVQFVIAAIFTIPVIPSTYVYKNNNENEEILSLDKNSMLILKIIGVTMYLLYILCNSIFTVLTSRELLRLKNILENNSTTSKKIMVQQRNMFIIVSLCSLSHLLKALQQFIIGVSTYIDMASLTTFIWSLYPLVNGLSTYAAPVCLVLLSPTVRSRFLKGFLPTTSGSSVDPTTSTQQRYAQ
ncbi:hypothetical protein PRIPAC_91423 [Pristionchus pacificus]|uniref:G protein-coupled receptor n=1 Tax=Pristionchus pacificus TaxID=54126 RepID=A0A2A6B6D0_PRIPA|nr:hypothetical protein PRIPAC_91423 [Pristionchus pacificus]|eukprot:PDM61439.1 G protein-coupled receptor [Pristionchus pacificus]